MQEGGGASSSYGPGGASSHTRPLSFSTSKTKRASHRGGGVGGGDEGVEGGGGRRRRRAGSFGGLEREGEFGAGLALPQDDFLLLLLLPLTVLLQLHALLVDLSLFLHDTQLILGLQHNREHTSDTQRAETAHRSRGGKKSNLI